MAFTEAHSLPMDATGQMLFLVCPNFPSVIKYWLYKRQWNVSYNPFHGDVETNLDLTKKNCRECRHLGLHVNERAGLDLGTCPICECVWVVCGMIAQYQVGKSLELYLSVLKGVFKGYVYICVCWLFSRKVENYGHCLTLSRLYLATFLLPLT